MNCQLFTFNSPKTSFLAPKPSLPVHGNHISRRESLCCPRRELVSKSIHASSKKAEPFSRAATVDKPIKVKTITTIKVTREGFLSKLNLLEGVSDLLTDLLRRSLRLELVSTELDPKTGQEKPTIKEYGHRASRKGDEVRFESNFEIPIGFGEVGAVVVENRHRDEMYFKDIVIQGLPSGDVNIGCNSWIQSAHETLPEKIFSKHDKPSKRIFFTNKSFLPSNTPGGLKRLRNEELENLRGNGQGKRETFDRIYDYDVYNDLGDPDRSSELARPVLGGKEHPYPRRCRTGRPPCKKDPSSESRGGSFYVPRDEAFADVKEQQFAVTTVKSALHALVPQIEGTLINKNQGFPNFTAIDSLFNEGIALQKQADRGILSFALPLGLVTKIDDKADEVLLFEVPELLQKDKFSWFTDEEFARQTLAGLNPLSIQLVTEWPLKSKLDPAVYGPPESRITTELVELEMKGGTTVESALKNKKLFILDYHDLYLPYVNKVRELEGRTMYGSRTLFYLTEEGTLRPIAIELTRPTKGENPQWKQVFTPGSDSTARWLWRLAKAHVCAHDAAYHQIVHHWLRTHCCVEPYIIAANRQLSALHPIYRLLHPHFRYTMEINALARKQLINANGIIESTFSPGKYLIEFSSVAYQKTWRFDMEGLPADLIRRGLAVEDPKARHGLRLTIEDYPFANDGLVLWDAIKEWVTDYVNYYYPTSDLVESDEELQAWWTEVQTKGHEDKKDEPWWPIVKTPEDLINVLATIIWVASGHHAAVNFGQYAYGGYFPNKPTMARTNMPNEEPSPDKFNSFLEKPEAELLNCFPAKVQATKAMLILDVLSYHSPDEEYIGDQIEPSWRDDPYIKDAFEKFTGRLKELEGVIDERNADFRLKNRSGAGVVPYELLKPFSQEGVTGKGVPNSISI